MELSRSEELALNLAEVRDHVEAAIRDAGRPPHSVSIIAVTKTWPASDIRLLAGLGLRDFAENRHQEAVAKTEELDDIGATWHFIGQIQRNKARAIARYADVIHTLDRAELVAPLAQGALDAGRSDVTVLIQVSLDPGADAGRGGLQPGDLDEVADLVAASGGLRLGGLMAVAPLGEDPYRAFEGLPELSARLVAKDARATTVSAGMSGDLDAAIACGATHVRVGTALLGRRAYLG